MKKYMIETLGDAEFLIKAFDKSKTITNESKDQKGGFISMFVGTLNANLLGNLWTGKGVKAKMKAKDSRNFNAASVYN